MFNRKEYMREYHQREEVKKHRKEYNKQWRKDNREKKLEQNRRHYQKYKDKRLEEAKKYYQKNKEKIWEYQRNKYKTDLKFNLNNKISKAIRKSLRGNKNSWHWEDLIGYTREDLIKHLKKTLPKGYTWNDYMEGKLHIDHIIPKNAFNYSKPEHPDFKRCWALSNLRLLPVKENIIKSNKLNKPFQPALKIC